MQKAFVELAEGVWEGIARVLDFEKNDYKRRHFSENLLTPPKGREGSLVVLLLAERTPSEGWRGRGQVPFLLAERAR